MRLTANSLSNFITPYNLIPLLVRLIDTFFCLAKFLLPILLGEMAVPLFQTRHLYPSRQVSS